MKIQVAPALDGANKRRVMKFSFDKDYCNNCHMRTAKAEKLNINCPAGRKNNPRSLDATLSVLRNNGKICSVNPARVHYGLPELIAMSQK